MARRQIITGIDIGNLFVKVVIAELDRDSWQPKIIGVGVAESHGLRKGVVLNMEEAIRDVGVAIRQAEGMAGTKIRQAYIAVGGPHLRSQLSRGIIAVSRADNEIDQGDIRRVIDAASIVNLPANREVVHILPRQYLIDGQESVKNPLGMKGVRLEAEVMIIDGLSPYIKNLAKCLSANDIEVIDFTFAPLAASHAALDKRQKEHGVLLFDFGGGVSTLSFFNEGELIYANTLPIGAQHITHDLAVALRTSLDQAEAVKLEHGFVGSSEVGKKEEIDLADLLKEDGFVITRKNLGRIIEDRVEELFHILQAEMKKIPHNGIIPSGLVLIGGGAKLPGLVNYAKEKLKLPVRIDGHYEFSSMVDRATDPSLAVAVGLVLGGIEKDFSNSRSGGGSSFPPLANSVKKIGGWLKNFMP